MEDMTQEIDPRFFIPPYVVGIEYDGTQEPSSDYTEQQSETVVEVDFVTDEEFSDESASGQQDEDRLLPPDFITLVSQTARVTSGATVVDVIIDVEDSARVSQFEVRVTK